MEDILLGVWGTSFGALRFETAPGQQLQGDWGTIRTVLGGHEVEVHFTVHTLGYSRRFHFWNTDREDAEHTYQGLIRACKWFRGVPAEVLVDNQKTAVLDHRIDGVPFNARFSRQATVVAIGVATTGER